MVTETMAPTFDLPVAATRSTRRRRPFSALVKKITELTTGSSSRRRPHLKHPDRNNPYGSAAPTPCPGAGTAMPDTSLHTLSTATAGDSADLTASARAAATSPNEDPDTSRSVGSISQYLASSATATTNRTAGGGRDSSRRGGDSTFSSPAPSERSLTTTLTTVQTLATVPILPGLHTTSATPSPAAASPWLAAPPHHHLHFSHPFPPTPASALPAYLAPSPYGPGYPTTYSTATANNLLTDNASILTLASSSKRHRRRSLDTDASVRALAPSSLWGGSRESLPLSVLSATLDGPPAAATTPVPAMSPQPSAGRVSAAGAERSSVYSAPAIPVPVTIAVSPALPSDRTGLQIRQPQAADPSNIRTGLATQARPDSFVGSLLPLRELGGAVEHTE